MKKKRPKHDEHDYAKWLHDEEIPKLAKQLIRDEFPKLVLEPDLRSPALIAILTERMQQVVQHDRELAAGTIFNAILKALDLQPSDMLCHLGEQAELLDASRPPSNEYGRFALKCYQLGEVADELHL